MGYVTLAEGYAGIKDYDNAIYVLNKALKYANTDEIRALIYYNIALCYYNTEDYSESRNYIKKSLGLNYSEQTRYLSAKIDVENKLYKQAIEEFQTLLQIHPDNIEYTISLANVYVIQHKYMSARKVLKDFVKNYPNNPEISRFRAYGFVGLFL